MYNKIRRIFALFALVFLLLAFLGVVHHDISPSHCIKSSCDDVICAVCICQNTIFKAVLTTVIATIVMIYAENVAKEALAVTAKVTARSFPMLC